MGQKVNPHGLRVGVIKDWDAKWYAEDGSTGLGISVHPNLDKSGSVTGMKKLGYWDKSDRIVLSHGWKYNIDRFVCDKKNDLEMIVADECMCRACLKRRGA